MNLIKRIFKKLLKWILVLAIFLLAFYYAFSFTVKAAKNPKLNATWEFGQEKAPEIIFSGDNSLKVKVKNLRDFNWLEKEKENQKKYLDYDFEISDIKGLKMGVSHFSPVSAIAHVFLIFDLGEEKKSFGLSIESRREKGEKFSLVGGLKYDYELIYVLATEDDLLNLREKRDEEIYMYPIKASPKKAQELFLQLSKKINSLSEKPEFYHLFEKNCTLLLANEVEKIADKKEAKDFPFFEKVFAPGYADEAIFKMGLIETEEKDFQKMKKSFLVDFGQSK